MSLQPVISSFFTLRCFCPLRNDSVILIFCLVIKYSPKADSCSDSGARIMLIPPSLGDVDYVQITASLSFTSVPQTDCIEFEIVDSTLAEPTEFFTINAGPVIATITIIDGSGKKISRKAHNNNTPPCNPVLKLKRFKPEVQQPREEFSNSAICK